MGVPRPGRTDPRRRPTSGAIPWLELSGKDPGRHYVGVQYKQKRTDGSLDDDDDTLVAEYESRGYRIETAGEEGKGLRFKFAHKTPKGQPMCRRGHVFMSIGPEEKAELDKYGEDGNGGTERADQIERDIYGDRGRNLGRQLAAEGGRDVQYGRPDSGFGVEVDAARR